MMLAHLNEWFRHPRVSRQGWILLGGLLLVGILIKMVYAPLSQKQVRIAALDRQLEEQSRETELVAQYEVRLADARSQCVSGDPSVVLHHYQQWLLRRAESQTEVTVSPGSVISEEPLGWRVKTELEGKAELTWLVQLIEDIENTPLMHRISFLHLSHSDRVENERMDFALTLEALVCKDAETMASWPVPVSATNTRELASFLDQRQPFSRGYLGEPPRETLTVQVQEPPTPIAVPEVDPLLTLRFVGSVMVNGKPKAFIFDSRTQQEIFVDPKTEFSFATFRGSITRVTPDALDLSGQTHPVRWLIGENLRDALRRAEAERG